MIKKKQTKKQEIVRFNVGGKLFYTTKETLSNDKESLLYSMATSKDSEREVDEEGRIFLDRDGTAFRHVLNYLRHGTFPQEHETDSFLRECEFFRVTVKDTRKKEFVFTSYQSARDFMYNVVQLGKIKPEKIISISHVQFRYADLLIAYMAPKPVTWENAPPIEIYPSEKDVKKEKSERDDDRDKICVIS